MHAYQLENQYFILFLSCIFKIVIYFIFKIVLFSFKNCIVFIYFILNGFL